jgi:hypothetical protein
LLMMQLNDVVGGSKESSLRGAVARWHGEEVTQGLCNPHVACLPGSFLGRVEPRFYGLLPQVPGQLCFNLFRSLY